MYQTLKYEKKGSIGVLTISRPEALNALNGQVITELQNFLQQDVEKDPTLRALIITGSGEKAFVAGADIKEIDALNVDQARSFAQKGQHVFRHLEVLRIPVIAAVNGFALGGGLELAMSCDFIIASDNARVGLPEVSLGIMPGFGGTQRLARYVGLQRAREMVYAGNHYKADEALQMGLVNQVVPLAELMNTAMKMAESMAAKGPIAIAKAKEAINRGFDLEIDEAMGLESDLFADLFTTEDQKIGTQAFINKQKPQFVGK